MMRARPARRRLILFQNSVPGRIRTGRLAVADARSSSARLVSSTAWVTIVGRDIIVCDVRIHTAPFAFSLQGNSYPS